jgi:uncharacterized protein YlxP (DUF503 family)
VYVGVLRVRLHIPAARSLKDRRMVVRRCVDRLRARTAVSVAEVGPLDRWQVATLGLCAVSNDATVTESQLLKALDVIEGAIIGDAVVTSHERELRRYEDTDFFGDLSVSPRGGHDGEGTDDDEELPR